MCRSLLLLLLLLLATMTLNQVQSFRINHQAGSHYINIYSGQQYNQVAYIYKSIISEYTRPNHHDLTRIYSINEH